MRLNENKEISTEINSKTMKTPHESRVSEEYEELMELEFSDFSDKEEFLMDRAKKIVNLKKQYEEVNENKDELEEFAKKGKEDLDKTIEDKNKELSYIPGLETNMEKLGFKVNWNPLNEKVAKQVLKIQDLWELTDQEAKQWFYIIRREEIKLKKALEIL